MTDKELIKQEIERLKNEQLSIFNEGKNDEICGTALNCIGVYNQLLSFINSLSEEPKCIYNRTLDERKKFCKYCSAACDVRIEEEPSSEALEEVASLYCHNLKNTGNGLYGYHITDAFKAGAEWQKEKHNKQFGFLNLKDCKDAYNRWKSTQDDNPSAALAWVRACEWQINQMMKNAVEGEVVYQIGSAAIVPTDIRYKVVSDRVYIPNVKLGDKVKIIIVKEN